MLDHPHDDVDKNDRHQQQRQGTADLRRRTLRPTFRKKALKAVTSFTALQRLRLGSG